MGFFRWRSDKKAAKPAEAEKKAEAPAAKPPLKPEEQIGIDGNRRALFRSLISPVQAVVAPEQKPVEENAGVILSKNPPQQRRVIRGGANAEVLAMLGPLARGETIEGYRLQRVTIGEQRIDVVFAKIAGPRREDLTNVAITLNGLEETEGQARWTTTSFRVCAAGDAQEPDMAAVTERVAREVAKTDRGQLWVVAASAPRGAQAQHHEPQRIAPRPPVVAPAPPVVVSAPAAPDGPAATPDAGDGGGAK